MIERGKFKEGDYVLIIGASLYPLYTYQQEVIDRKIPVKITNCFYDAPKVSFDEEIYLEIELKGLSQKYTCVCKTRDIAIISEKDLPKYMKNKEDYEKELASAKDILIERITTVPTEGYEERDFNHSSRQQLETNHNVVVPGSWNKNNGTFVNGSPNYLAACCAFTKRAGVDHEVYIPKVWLHYYGYTTRDLVQWLKFLSNCGIGFEYEFLGDKELEVSVFKNNDAFKRDKNTEGDHYIAINANKTTLTAAKSQYRPNKTSGYICVRINGDATSPMKSYIRFIVLRYMYNCHYWSIPGTAMQIKDALGARVTHWGALLMAHLRQSYYGYYCMPANRSFNPTMDKDRSRNTGNGNLDSHANPFQTAESIMGKFNNPNVLDMNSTFAYLDNTFKQEELDVFFESKDYLGLYKYLKEKVNGSK